jgi:acyl transferase domain-containing protein
VASLVAIASAEAGADVAHLIAHGGRALGTTAIEQPAMVAVCLGLHRLLERRGVRPAFVMGHSLGELTAWAAAGGIAHEHAVAIAARRGRLMAREAARHPGGMLRLTGDRETCEAAIRLGSQVGSICVGAHNGDLEWAVSGDEAALALVQARFRASRLPVAGAWHSPAIAGAVDELRDALAALPRSPMRARAIANRDGSFAADADMPELLAGQLVRPVRWADMLRTALGAGARRFIAVGPGKTLRALIHLELGVGHRVEIADSVRAVAEIARG